VDSPETTHAERDSGGMAELTRQSFLQPWYESLDDPITAQDALLDDLLGVYRRTNYGLERGAEEVSSIGEYRERFPPLTYDSMRPLLDRVRGGDYSSILPESPECWVMTRGTTGSSKVIPVTRTHVEQVRTCGARAILNFALKNPECGLLRANVLNLNFPSVVATMRAGDSEVSYGYSSGTYARLIPRLGSTSLVPDQEEIDALGPGIERHDWHARFELVYRRSKEENVRAVMGVAPVVRSFARYVKKTHGTLPRDLWDMDALFLTSVPKIQSNYAPMIRKLYGDAPVVEMYTATEGAFAQQLDDLPYISPNYDAYLFDVDDGSKTRMLHEMERGQWGRLIVSSCLFPRYVIGDLIECMGKHYFRVFGRDRLRTVLIHQAYRLLTRWFI
jgi:hypothetical protein